MSEDDINRRANEKRRKHKQAKDKILAKKVREGGLLIVHTGKGKGKTTAAMGMVARAIGHGLGHRDRFRTQGQAVAGVFDIRSGHDAAICKT